MFNYCLNNIHFIKSFCIISYRTEAFLWQKSGSHVKHTYCTLTYCTVCSKKTLKINIPKTNKCLTWMAKKKLASFTILLTKIKYTFAFK
ncbi:hypothetical protein FKM82_001499 [Ascaphus truei]